MSRTYVIDEMDYERECSFYGTGIYGTNKYGEIATPNQRIFIVNTCSIILAIALSIQIVVGLLGG